MVKNSMPHLRLKDGNAIDLYFEFLAPKERLEVYRDLLRGYDIELPDYGQMRNKPNEVNLDDFPDEIELNRVRRFLKKDTTTPVLDYDENQHRYKLANTDFVNKTYSFNDIPEKKKYIFDRVKEIYDDVSSDIINQILDNVKIVFRKQDEKGASSHFKRTIYISLNEIKKYDMKDEKDFLKYLNHPKSIITHETTHLFQNLFKAFPHVKYLYKDDGKWKINYKKYVTDKGEIQARVEQIIELLNWGFEKQEIVNFLYSRKYNDPDLWRKLVDQAIELKKESASKLPGPDTDEDMLNDENEQGKMMDGRTKKDRGTNYERNWMT